MHRSGSLLIYIFLICTLMLDAQAQHVYEKGTFVSIPAGKHINHSHYSTWHVYFAVEDGVLVYDHHRGQWLEPITASNGLSQYPVLLVWQNATTQDLWIVTPDFVFVYDELADWMSRVPLPADPKFSGTYQLGVTDTDIIVSATSSEDGRKYSALFSKTAGTFELWGANTALDVDWDIVEWVPSISTELDDIYESLPVQNIANGSFDAEGKIHLDGHPRNSSGAVSSLTGESGAGEAFLSTYGMGIFHQTISGGEFTSLPYGLLSPDVMSMQIFKNQLVVGGRAGLTYMDSSLFEYDEAIEEIAQDYSFVTAIDTLANDLFIAGRGGVFRKKHLKAGWNRVVTLKDLTSERIYSLATGRDGNIMIATERNAYLFHESGLELRTLFPAGLDWPVFDVHFADGRYYISSFYGLYIFDEASLSFIGRVTSSGDFLPPSAGAAVDPIYESEIQGNMLWATTHRGIVAHHLLTKEGAFHLSPDSPFKPRGLAIVGKTVWIGTDIGLYSFDSKSGAWRHFTRNDGLISNFVTDIVALDGYIWAGTNLGLTRIKWKNLY